MAGDSKEVARAHLADAGVEELPDDWDVVTLGDLFTEDRGIAVGVMYPGDHDPDGVPLIKAGDLNGSTINPEPDFRISKDKHQEYRRTALEGGELLMTLVGNVGQCAVVPPRMAGWNTARAVAVMRLADSSETHFVQQCLLSRPLQHLMDVWCNTTVQATLNLKEIRQLPLPWPPKKSRDAIAAFGKALDDKIELNRRMNATLEAMARALFQSWFVDFDPVRAKLDARQPVGMDPATAALFPEHFAHGEHDMLPVGWRHATIEEVCAINAWTLGKNDQLKTLEYVEISEVSRGNIANIATYVRGEEPSRARRRLRHGDTVLSTVRPDRGSYFLALNVPENRVASTGFAVLTPTKVPWSFLHAALTQPEVSDHLGQMADGGAYPAVRPEIIGAMQVALPNEPKILEAFHRTCAPLFEQAEANRTQSRTIATLRDTLLPNLLSGELSVAATDKEIFVSSKHIKRTMNP
jgi:type I restriction enzyme S subunit